MYRNSSGSYISLAVLLAAAAIVQLVGCGGDRSNGFSLNPFRVIQPKTDALTHDELQRQLMSFADASLARLEEAANALAESNSTPERRIDIQAAKLYPAATLVALAADVNSDDALLDMLVFVSLQKRVVEEGWAERTFGEQGKLLVDAWRELDEALWRIGRRVLTNEQVDELRQLVDEWRRANPDRVAVSTVRFEDFAKLRPNRTGPNPFEQGLRLLNPLDDTAREVERSRAFAERATFIAQRMPLLLSWHAQYLVFQLAGQPEVRNSLVRLDELTVIAERYADLFEQLPSTISTEREAILRSVSEELTRQRTETLDEIDRRRADLNDTLTQTNVTLDRARETATTAKELATEVNKAVNAADQALKTLDTVIHPPTASQPAGSAAAKSSPPTAKDAAAAPEKPFDIEEYRRATEELRHTLVEAQNVLKSSDDLLASRALDKRLADVDALVSRRIDQAFQSALWLVIWSTLIIAAVVIISRFVFRRRAT